MAPSNLATIRVSPAYTLHWRPSLRLSQNSQRPVLHPTLCCMYREVTVLSPPVSDLSLHPSSMYLRNRPFFLSGIRPRNMRMALVLDLHGSAILVDIDWRIGGEQLRDYLGSEQYHISVLG